MPVLVKDILICMAVTSVNGGPATLGSAKCVPMEENPTNAINEEAFEEYDTVRTLFFTPVDVEDNLMHGALILGASVTSTATESEDE